MDFSYLLELAKDNDKFNKKEAAVSRFSTKVSRPKKVERAAPKLEAIQAVLSRKEELKQKENEEARRKKENLLALRAQDRKSNQRVKAMINRNKGASKSVLDDAKDITTAKGEEQCDEDDYGYESTMSQTIFSKLANQYANMPEDDKLRFVKASTKSSIADIKSRVINTLKKEEEDELAPRKRKRKSKQATEDDDFINDGDAYDGASSKSELKSTSSSSSQKVVNINFTNYKSDKFNNFKYDGDKEKKKYKEDNREEKKKNRDDYKEKKRDREDNNERVKEIEVFNEKKSKKLKDKKPRPAAPPPMSFEELLRVAQRKQAEPLPVLKEEKKEKEKEKPQKDLGRPLTAKEKEELEDERRRKLKRLGKLPQDKIELEKPKEKEQKADVEDSPKIRKNGEKIIKKENPTKLQQALEKPKPEPKVIDKSKYFATAGQKPRDPPQIKEIKPVQNSKPPAPKTQTSTGKDFAPRDMKPPKPRDFPPKDMKPPKSQKVLQKSKVRDLPPPPPKRPAYNPPPKMRIASDSEEEDDDSDMDDFIDDGDQGIDISSEIRNLFGYDKRKYQDDDDDCDDMEASFSQMQKEERISAKIGLKEDLEDIQREEEERKRKMMRMKQLKKSRR
nr:protein SPT2 homolog [Procambarus clarkii]